MPWAASSSVTLTSCRCSHTVEIHHTGEVLKKLPLSTALIIWYRSKSYITVCRKGLLSADTIGFWWGGGWAIKWTEKCSRAPLHRSNTNATLWHVLLLQGLRNMWIKVKWINTKGNVNSCFSRFYGYCTISSKSAKCSPENIEFWSISTTHMGK